MDNPLQPSLIKRMSTKKIMLKLISAALKVPLCWLIAKKTRLNIWEVTHNCINIGTVSQNQNTWYQQLINSKDIKINQNMVQEFSNNDFVILSLYEWPLPGNKSRISFGKFYSHLIIWYVQLFCKWLFKTNWKVFKLLKICCWFKFLNRWVKFRFTSVRLKYFRFLSYSSMAR